MTKAMNKRCKIGPWMDQSKGIKSWCCIGHAEDYCNDKNMNEDKKLSKSDKDKIECKDCKTLASQDSVYAYGKQKCSYHRKREKEQI